MSKIIIKITTIARNSAFLKLYGFYRKHLLKSALSFNEEKDRDVKNWGKTAEYLPEVGECYISTSFYQFEEEWVRANAFA